MSSRHGFHGRVKPGIMLMATCLAMWYLVLQWLESRSPLCRLIQEEINKCHVAIPPPPGGYRTLVDEPAFTQAELHVLESDFERRLDAMVSFAEQVKALPILILPPANDFDYEPNRSYFAAADNPFPARGVRVRVPRCERERGKRPREKPRALPIAP